MSKRNSTRDNGRKYPSGNVKRKKSQNPLKENQEDSFNRYLKGTTFESSEEISLKNETVDRTEEAMKPIEGKREEQEADGEYIDPQTDDDTTSSSDHEEIT